MKKTAKKFLLSVFVVLMVFTCALLCGKNGTADVSITTTVFAAVDGPYTYELSDGNAKILYVDAPVSENVVIPSTLGGYKVTEIGTEIFKFCQVSIKSITIPDGVTTIDENAFKDCYSLASITIPDSVTSIGKGVVVGTEYYRDDSNWQNDVLYIGNHLICAAIADTSYNVKQGTKTIADYAFACCNDLTEVIIPDSVTSVGKYAFEDCYALASITISDSVTSIGYGAFFFTAYFDDDSNWQNDALYIGNHLIRAVPSDASYNIKQGTKTIADFAFSECKKIENITIPDSVTSIGKNAFYRCENLKGIDIPDSVTSIGEKAFYGCSELASVTISENITSIDSGVFFYCNSLTDVTIPDKVTSIGDEAFFGCYNITDITIPKNVTSVGAEAFSCCIRLTDITIPKNVTTIGESAFDGCYALKSITIDAGITSISNYLFNKCTSLTSITIPKSVTSIGYSAFFGCTSLTDVTISESVTTIDSSAFQDCTSIVNITIPDSVTKINSAAFMDCSGLTDITLSNRLTSISEEVFYGCKSLKSITIPKSVGSIDSCAFRDCTSLTDVTISDGVTKIGSSAFRDCTNLPDITIPESVSKIGSYAFYDCTNLTGITIPAGIKSIGSNAFYGTGCYADESNWYNNGFYIDNHLIEASVSGSSYDIKPGTKTIAVGVFKNCTTLKNINIPDSVIMIGAEAFSGCTGLTDVTIPDSVTTINSSAFYNCTGLVNITISKNAITIGESAFRKCKKLPSVTIPGSVKSIGDSAFRDCTSLKKITIPDSVTSMGEALLAGCTKLPSIKIPKSITMISKAAFSGCTSLTDVTIPESVTTIGSSAFSGCTSLTDVTIPESVTTIGSSAFKDCTSIVNITIPESVTSIGAFAFEKCQSITEVIVPESVSYLGFGAFMDCISLTKITLPFLGEIPGEKGGRLSDAFGVTGEEYDTTSVPSSLREVIITAPCKEISYYAFDDCYDIISITLPATITTIDKGAFMDCDSLEYIFYNGTEAQKKNISIAEGNSKLTSGAVWHFNANGHSFGSYTTTKAATCTAAGEKQRSCSVCNYVETATVSKRGHSYSTKFTVDKKATCTAAGSKSKHCTRSGCTAKTSVTTIAKLAHTYDNACDKKCNVCSATREITHSYKTTTTKATLSKNGSVKTACAVCGNVKSSKVISYPKTFTLSATSLTYNGSVRTPSVTVKDANGKVLTKGTDYTVTYASGRINIGTYNVTVKMKGNYTGSKTLSFKIKPIDISACKIKLSDTSYTYDGKVKKPTVTVTNAYGTTLKATNYTVTYAAGRVNAGTYKVTVTMKGIYTGTKTLTFKINPINISTCTVKLSNTSYVFNGNVKTPDVTVANSYGTKLTKGTHYTVSYAEGRKNAGTYKVTVTMKGNYTGTKTLSFRIKPLDISVCTVKLSTANYTFDGKVKAPAVTIINSHGTKLTNGTHYTVSYSEGRRNVGTYKVTVTMKGNYTGSKTLSFKINPANISTCKVKLSNTSYTYNGKVKTPTVTVTNANGTKLTNGTSYTVSYAAGRKNTGTYKVTVTMKGNYTGTKNLTFKINPVNISACKVKLSNASYTFDGKVKTPVVTVTDPNGTKLTKGTHYTVTYSDGRKNTGAYKVTVKMRGNYTGTKTLTFKINPPATTVAALTAGVKKITVNLKKQTTQTTGYQIQYATNKDFTNAKTVTLAKNTTVKTTLSGLASAKTYYVRVRTFKTVNNVKYYSGWSAYKYVKTK